MGLSLTRDKPADIGAMAGGVRDAALAMAATPPLDRASDSRAPVALALDSAAAHPHLCETHPTDEASPTDAFDDKALTGKSPQRRCIVTREVMDKSAMIRFVLDPENQVVPDLRQRLPGRGLWVKADPTALVQAIKVNAFAKAAKQSAKIPADLLARIAGLLRQDVAHLLGLARKSADLTTGFEKVERELRANRVRMLIAASDAAEDGRTKLARLAGSDVEICSPLSAAELAAALGRETVVHVALKPSGIAERLHLACQRLAAFSAADVSVSGKRH